MKTIKLFILITSAISLVLVSSCKKDDDNNPDNNAKQYETKTVTVPDAMAQSSDPGAQEATAYLNMVNSMATYGSMMTPPSKSTPVTNYKDGGTEVYTWEVNEGMNNNYTATLTIIETATMYSWQMSITGTMDSYTFTNFVFISAESTKDGMQSSITLYEFDGSGIAMTMSWQDNGNSATFNFEVPGSIRLTVGVNADDSGWMEVYEWNGQSFYLDFRIEWNAAGHGEWWEYIDGVISDSGSF